MARHRNARCACTESGYVTHSLFDAAGWLGVSRSTLQYRLRTLALGRKLGGRHHLTRDELARLRRVFRRRGR